MAEIIGKDGTTSEFDPEKRIAQQILDIVMEEARVELDIPKSEDTHTAYLVI